MGPPLLVRRCKASSANLLAYPGGCTPVGGVYIPVTLLDPDLAEGLNVGGVLSWCCGIETSNSICEPKYRRK